MAQPKGYVDSDYLRTIADFVKNIKERTYSLMEVQVGQKVLDMGCGPASDTIPLAALVGQSGFVQGLDYDQGMVDEAEKLAANAGVSAWVKHQRADADALPFEDNTFDASRSERVFQHLLNPEKAFSEMLRVTKSGGCLLILDTDWASMSIASPEYDIERRIIRTHTEKMCNNGYGARSLYRLFKQHGLTDIRFEIFPVSSTSYAFFRQGANLDKCEETALREGILTEEELQCWRKSLEDADAIGGFFGCVNQVLVVGRKP
jgi:ubiquinone/menaquinone biosynthesis C-methylase UbiE